MAKFDSEETLIRSWRLDAVKFVEECLGINKSNGYHISQQQKQALKALSDIAHAKGVIACCADGSRKQHPTGEHTELAKKRGISIMSGKGTGKDAFASWAILWMLCTHDAPKIICTAPTQDQLRQVLWSEVATWHDRRNSKGDPMFLMRNNIAVEASKIYMKGVTDTKNLKDGTFWSAFYRTPQRNVDRSQMQKTISGYHADNMMVVMDEASGIDNGVFEELENTLIGRKNFAILIFNPHKPSGFAYDTHYGRHINQWVRFHWDAEESDIVSKQHILSLEEKYGRDSDNFRVNVNGLPPRGGDDALIPYQWVYEAYNRELMVSKETKMVIGVDVASTGKDDTIITVRHGPKVLEQRRVVEVDTIMQKEEIEKIIKQDYAQYDLGGIFIDTQALGQGLYSLTSRVFPGLTHSIKVSSKPRDDKRFRILRDELWWKMRTAFEEGLIQIPSLNDLLEELNCVKYSSESGKIVVDNKKNIRKRLGHSCDRADSLMLTFAMDAISLMPYKPRDRFRRRFVKFEAPVANAWMGV